MQIEYDPKRPNLLIQFDKCVLEIFKKSTIKKRF